MTLDSVYQSLSMIKEIKDDFQQHLHQKVSETEGRDTSVVFFDVTNYYFETDLEDTLKKGWRIQRKKENTDCSNEFSH